MKAKNIFHAEPGDASSVSAPAKNVSPTSSYSAEVLQHLIDQVAGFNLYVSPGPVSKLDGGSGEFVLSETLSRFDLRLHPPSQDGIRSTNTLGEMVGRLDLRWSMIPDDFVARPDHAPQTCPFNAASSQRFVMQDSTFTFGSGRVGFRVFGTGRTFPMMVGSQPRVVAAAVGNVVEGFGKFRDHEGNITVCGDLQPGGFKGHILVRIVDLAGNLRMQSDLSPLQSQPDPDPHTTYLQWAAQKGDGADQENRFSFASDGQPRGMNIPTRLKLLHLDCSVEEEFHGKDFRIERSIGQEIGFGKGSVPGAPLAGSAESPFLFDGIAKYSFQDRAGRTVGSITSNVLEGRRFDMELPGASSPPALRFGFFGPIIHGSGCFAGVEGMFYGATGSVLIPPPGIHVITHFYTARIHHPNQSFRFLNEAR